MKHIKYSNEIKKGGRKRRQAASRIVEMVFTMYCSVFISWPKYTEAARCTMTSQTGILSGKAPWKSHRISF